MIQYSVALTFLPLANAYFSKMYFSKNGLLTQCAILDWILKQKKDLGGKTVEI